MAAQVLRRSQQAGAVSSRTVRAWLDRLFPAPASGPAGDNGPARDVGPGTATAATPAPSTPAIDWQKVACAVALRGRLTVITGGPGTGKTYTAARLLALLLAVDSAPQRLRVALAAPTGKAAARLKQSIDAALAGLPQRLSAGPGDRADDPAGEWSGDWSVDRPRDLPGDPPDEPPGCPPGDPPGDRPGDRPDDPLALRALAAHSGPARTLHALLGARPDTRQFRFAAAHPLPLDVLIVDEASMVHLEMMAALLAALPASARLVLLGDKDQLASVEAGAVLGDLCRSADAGHYRPDTAAYILAATGQAVPAALVSGGSAVASPLAQQTVMLRQSRRYGGPIGALALAVNAGAARQASALLAAAPGGPLWRLDAPGPAALLRLALHGRAGAEGGYLHYLDVLHSRPADRDSADSADGASGGNTANSADRASSASRASRASSANVARHAAWVRAVLTAFLTASACCARCATALGAASN